VKAFLFISVSLLIMGGSAEANHVCWPPDGHGVILAGCSPLMIHRSSTGLAYIKFSSPADGVNFDILNDGTHPRISWPIDPQVDVFVSLPDADGQILSSQQLFGNNTVGPDGKKAANGFLALAKWAPVGARFVDSSMPIYSKLRLWADLNRNGVVDPEELSTLEENGISEINLTYININDSDQYGNAIREISDVLTYGLQKLLIFDVWFNSAK